MLDFESSFKNLKFKMFKLSKLFAVSKSLKSAVVVDLQRDYSVIL